MRNRNYQSHLDRCQRNCIITFPFKSKYIIPFPSKSYHANIGNFRDISIHTTVITVTAKISNYQLLLNRARSLRNLLVSGNECGRVFPAGVGPGSPSRDAANWLPSRFSLSVETRRRYGWLRMMVFPGARLFPSPNLVPFGRVAARERQGALSRRAW